jgi:hypothetical protein
MNQQDGGLPLVLRMLGAVAGVFGGGFLGILILISVMIFTDQSLGLRSAIPGGAVGAVIGGIVGWAWPMIWGKAFFELISRI